MAEYICCRSCIEPDCRGCNMYILEKALKQGRFKQLKDNSKTIHITADVQPVVLCRDCVNYVESEEVNGEKMCVRDADWSIEDGCYYGFTEYPSPDWFCADGERRDDVS